jgi:type VI secretion system protein ImpE
MASAKELFDKGELGPAIEAQTQDVRNSPADTSRRIFLFELLCFAGDWDRAEKQIEVLGGQSPEAGMAVAEYRGVILGERERAKLFAGGGAPHFLREPPKYVDLHVEAIKQLSQGNAAEARRLLDEAEDARPAFTGTLDGEAFEDFRDYDDLVAPVLEVYFRGRYVWVPFEQILRIEIPAPKTLRDLLWSRAKIEADDGTIGDVFASCLYASSTQHANSLVRLGRMTEWKQVSDDLQVACGLKTYLAGEKEVPITEMRKVNFKRG